MENELLANLQKMLDEKAKLTPEVLKKGVTVFGVTGTYEGESGEA